MSERKRRQLERTFTRIVEAWQDRLGLKHWSITINFETPCNPEADASINKHQHYFDAQIRLTPGWGAWSNYVMNYIACHELLHVAMRDVDYANEQALEHCEQDDAALLESWYSHALESFIDRLTTEMVKYMGQVT